MPELAGTARLDAQVPSIEALLAALGPAAPPDLAATGAVELGADVTLAAELEQIGVDLDLRGQGLGGLPDQLDQLIGASPSVTSTVTLRPGEQRAGRCARRVDRRPAAAGRSRPRSRREPSR